MHVNTELLGFVCNDRVVRFVCNDSCQGLYVMTELSGFVCNDSCQVLYVMTELLDLYVMTVVRVCM